MDIMVKLVGWGPGLWVVLLKIYWVWNTSNDLSKNALILLIKFHPLFHLAHPKYTYCTLHSNIPKKWGI
jgi:hypothetical protein